LIETTPIGSVFEHVDERRIGPVACHGEPFVKGSKGEPPPWPQGGFMPRPRRGGRERSERRKRVFPSELTLRLRTRVPGLMWARQQAAYRCSPVTHMGYPSLGLGRWIKRHQKYV
jgi:hypothetical protein